MGVKATWGPKSFYTSPGRVIPFGDFSTSVTLKSDSENDTSGTEPTNTRGRDLQPFSCSTTYHAAGGNDPMAEFNSWVKLIGMYYPIYIGGRRLGPAERFLLQSVSASDMQQAENGAVLSLTLNLSFNEYSEGKSSKLANVTGSPSPSSSKIDTDKDKEWRNALGLTASTSDKAEKKGGGDNRWSQVAMET